MHFSKPFKLWPAVNSLVIFFLLHAQIIIAQNNVDTLEAHQYFTEGDIQVDSGYVKKGLISFQKALDLYQGALGPTHLKVATVWDKIGGCYNRQFKLERAEAAFNRALGIRQELLGTENNIAIAVSYYSLGLVEENKGQYRAALDHYQKALDIHQIIKGDSIFAGKIYNGFGNVLKEQGKYYEALEAYQKVHDLWLPTLGTDHFYASIVFNGLAMVYSLVGDYNRSLENYQKSLEVQVQTRGRTHLRTTNLYNNIGILYNDKGDYENALNHHQNALSLRLKLLPPDHPYIAYSYTNLGTVYSNLLNHDRAKEHYQQALRIFQTNFGENHHRVIMAHTSLGNMFNCLGKYEEALDHQKKAIKGLGSLKNKGLFYPDPYLNIGNVYRNMGELEKALYFNQKALELYIQKAQEYIPNISSTHRAIGKIHHEGAAHEKALKHFKKASDLLLQIAGPTHPKLSGIYLEMATIYEKTGQLESALNYCELALTSLNWKEEESVENSNVFLLQRLFYATGAKARILSAFYKSHHAREYQEQAEQYYQYALALFHQSKNGYQTPSERQSFVENSFQFFEEAIANHILFYHLDNQARYIHKTFIFSEESKGLNLLEAVKKAPLPSASSIPLALLQKEKELAIDISFYEKQCFLEAEKGADENQQLIESWKATLFDLRESYRNLKEQLAVDYPYYHLNNSKSTIPSISAIQEKILDKEETLIEFFIGEDVIYVFLLQQEDIQFKILPKDFPLEDLVIQMRESIYEYWIMPGRPDSLYGINNQKYLETAHLLFQKIIAPFDSLLTKKLILVPDEVLHLLPFDALLTQAHNSNWNFKTLPFFIQKYQISYTFSAAIQYEIEDRKKTHPSQKLLAFAPSFKASKQDVMAHVNQIRKGLSPLKYNAQECQQIHSIWGGSIFLGSEATIQTFLDAVKTPSEVIHLATHAKSNDQSGDYSFISFSEQLDSAATGNKLYIQDLYNLSIPSEMVVLSACETGLGEIKPGEGIINLALGFTYAGVNSVVTSLWSVDDFASMELMTQFYKNLKNGLAKDEALWQAKLQFIQDQPNAAPFFWAGFIPNGKMEALSSSRKLFTSGSLGLIGILMFSSLLVGLFFLLKLRQPTIR